MEEEWVPIPDFEDYLVSNRGQIYSQKTHRMIRLQENTDGYKCFSAWVNGGNKTLYVSHLVAQLFLPAEADKTEVDHINRDISDNRVENLRWANRSMQNKNKRCYNKTGHKYISKHIQAQGYIVKVYKTKSKYFKSLEEALSYRNSLLAQEGQG